MPTVCETNWHTSRSCRLSTGDGFNQVFTTIGFRNDVGNSDRICVKIVKQGFTVFAQQNKSPVTLASSQVYWRKFYFYFFHHSYRKEMLLRRYITTTYGKQRNHLLNSRFFILNRPLLSASREYTPRRLPFFVFCGSRLLPFFSWKMSSSYFFSSFQPERRFLFFLSLLF